MRFLNGIKEQLRKYGLEKQIQDLVELPPEVLIAIGEYLKNPAKPNMEEIITDDMSSHDVMLVTMFILSYIHKVAKPDKDAFGKVADKLNSIIEQETGRSL